MALVLLLVATSLRADVEVRLVDGRVLRGSRVERTAAHVTVFSQSGSIRVDAAKVASVTELEAAPARETRLNFTEDVSETADAARDPARGQAVLGARPVLEGDAWRRSPEIAALVRRRDYLGAERVARREAIARPEDRVAAIALGEILLAQARHGDAVTALRSVMVSGLEDSLRRARDLALAEALARLQRVDEAQSVLRQTPPDAEGRVAEALATLSPDLSLSERPFGSSAHFVLVGPPGSRPREIDSLLSQMERIHSELTRQLGGSPRDRITVILHPGTEFWETTGMGSGVGALYDGRMRIPAGGLSSPSGSLLATIRHEMAHAFIEALAGGRADVRWHEGIAEHFEGSDARATIRELKRAARSGGAWPPAISHASSHARLEWFLSRWGMEGVRGVLAALASRGTIDEAVRSVTGLGESELDEAWRRDLASETR